MALSQKVNNILQWLFSICLDAGRFVCVFNNRTFILTPHYSRLPITNMLKFHKFGKYFIHFGILRCGFHATKCRAQYTNDYHADLETESII